jgi:hypothetical protein
MTVWIHNATIKGMHHTKLHEGTRMWCPGNKFWYFPMHNFMVPSIPRTIKTVKRFDMKGLRQTYLQCCDVYYSSLATSSASSVSLVWKEGNKNDSARASICPIINKDVLSKKKRRVHTDLCFFIVTCTFNFVLLQQVEEKDQSKLLVEYHKNRRSNASPSYWSDSHIVLSVRLYPSVPYKKENGEHGEIFTDKISRMSIYLSFNYHPLSLPAYHQC